MPDEDMELTTDYAGVAEDIDIDVEFATPQPDDDIELGDFDQTGSAHHFTSDVHDELMAEGDDTSYGMIDEDEIDYNEGVVAANDDDIVDAGANDDTWQSVPTTSGNLSGQVDEIDYAHPAEDDDLAQQHNANDDDIHHEGEPPSGELVISLNQSAAEHHDNGDAAALSSDAHALLETLNSTNGDSTLGEERDDIQDHVEPGNEVNITGLEQDDSHHYEQIDSHARAADELPGDGSTDQEKIGIASSGAVDVTAVFDVHEAQQEPEHLVDQEELIHQSSAEFTGYDDPDEYHEGSALPLDLHQDAPSVEQFPIGSHDTDEHWVDQLAHATPNGGEEVMAHLNSETSNDQQHRTEVVLQETEESVTGSNGHAEADHSRSLSPEPDRGQNSSSIGKAAVTEHPASIATRYEMFINYGRTDYRLFAKSESDDPNQYFLSDISALDRTLAEFLSSLRDVISQEVSPLDELVLHVDGLGLEFGESMTSDFLDRYTFGDILALFDTLVKNEETESSPDLYCYLMIRPNCSQRLAALVDQANTGRGLTDVAIYREVTPMPNEGDTLGEDEQLAITPDDGHDNQFYGNDEEYEEEHFEENDQAAVPDDDVEKTEPEPGDAASAADTDDGTSRGDHLSGDQSADLDKDHAAEDDLVDYDNIDIGPSQHVSNLPDTTSNKAGEAASKEPLGDVEPLLATEDGPKRESASHSTSATATLDGDDKDEIDYSDNEENVDDKNAGKENPTTEQPVPAAKLQVPVDDEITWESEDEGPHDVSASKHSVQASPTSGKRTRSASGDLESAREQKDVKRRRS